MTNHRARRLELTHAGLDEDLGEAANQVDAHQRAS